MATGIRALAIIALVALMHENEILAQTSNELVDQGNVLLNAGKYEDAAAVYTKAAELDRQNKFAYGNRGLAKRNLKKYKEAIKDYDEALKIDSTFAWAYSSRADAFLQLKKYDKALSDLDKAIALKPTDAYTFLVRGDVKTQMNKVAEAGEDYEQAIAVDPTYAWAYISRGDNRMRLLKYDQALADYNHAVELNPDLDWAYFRRGMIEYFRADYASAESDFNKASAIKNDKFYHVWMFFAQNKSKNKKAAVQDLKTYWITARLEQPQFVGFIIRHLIGELTDVQVVDSAQTFTGQSVPENLCEGSFYIGMNAFVKGDEQLARKYWNLCLKTKVTNFIEYNYAGTYLGKLK